MTILNFIVDEKNFMIWRLMKGIYVCVQMYFGMSKSVLGFDAKYPLGIKQVYRFVISKWFLEGLKLDSYPMISIKIIWTRINI
jgi:hypothetical protein